MHEGRSVSSFAISTVAGSLVQQFGFRGSWGGQRDRIDRTGAQGPMRPFGSHRRRFAGPDHFAGTRERRLGTRLQLQPRSRRPISGGRGLFAGRPVILWSLRLHGNGK
jgi:hypothetical protein